MSQGGSQRTGHQEGRSPGRSDFRKLLHLPAVPAGDDEQSPGVLKRWLPHRPVVLHWRTGRMWENSHLHRHRTRPAEEIGRMQVHDVEG